MASDAGVSTNTLLVVAALAVVAVVMYRRQGAASGMGAASGGAGDRGGTRSGDSTSDIIKAATEAAIGVGALIRKYSTDENEDAALSSANASYLGTPCRANTDCGFGEQCSAGGVCEPQG